MVGNEIPKMEEILQAVNNQKSDLQEIKSNMILQENITQLFLLRDHLDVYKTETIPSTHNLQSSTECHYNNSYAQIHSTIKRTICYRTLCCHFNIEMMTKYSRNHTDTKRGDSFIKYYYRLAAFDGIRTYSGYSTGGIQVCSIVPCVNDTLASCGLRSDNLSAQPQRFIYDDNLIQTDTVFESIEITSVFEYNNTLVFPDILVTGTDDNYGALVLSDVFVYSSTVAPNSTAVSFLKTTKPIKNLISIAIYARQFSRDGGKEDTVIPSSQTSAAAPIPKYHLFYICLFLMYYIFNVVVSVDKIYFLYLKIMC